MARSIWSGVLTFGLVTVPVGLFTATEDHTVHFHQLQRGTGDRIRYKRINERTGEEVPTDDIVKGYDLGEGDYVVVEPEELDDIAPGKSKVIDMTGFVDLDRIEPVYFDRTYYVAPRGKEYVKVYELLRAALERSNKAGIATFTMRSKQYLTALRAQDDVLVMHTMRWADEVRDPREDLDVMPARRPEVADRELRTAQQLIDALSIDWDPNDYHDTYEERVKELVAAKREGKEVVGEEGPPDATNVVDLMSALERSVERNRGGGKSKGKDGRRKAPAKTRKRPDEDLSSLTKSELYRRATDADVPGRSKMSREQLVEALTGRKARKGRKAAA
ncbi:Ku protein [Streptomyces alfalfae]|uniref:Non-homologous end joining protein Ku n=1 Tax=Streptomyces alfalfae TaxID=1642299 RepID=A0A7T4PLW7_9ACTN|nr:Ku protein [Streptomyces alfalfae]QQC92607.1 Ku protein [Streptomyces alfalfae]